MVYVIAYALRVVEFAKHHENAVLLMLLQHLVEGIVDREDEDKHESENGHHLDDAFLFGDDIINQSKDEQTAQDDIHDFLAPNQSEDK